MKHTITKQDIQGYLGYLRSEEKSASTIEKYGKTLQDFLSKTSSVDKEAVLQWKQGLVSCYAVSTCNTKIAAINGFLSFMGWEECIVKPLKVQRRVFCAQEKELSKEEYQRLVATAEEQGKTKLSLLLQLIASTGIRVSEVRYITVEAVECGQVEIRLKGKVRVILLPGKLCRKLRKYYKSQCIVSGPIFLGRTGAPMRRQVIWLQMKKLCQTADVLPEKVFPHNFRHLFARCFYRIYKDVAKLADLLGHSSIDTTRIYLLSSGAEHRQALESMKMIC